MAPSMQCINNQGPDEHFFDVISLSITLALFYMKLHHWGYYETLFQLETVRPVYFSQGC